MKKVKRLYDYFFKKIDVELYICRECGFICDHSKYVTLLCPACSLNYYESKDYVTKYQIKKIIKKLKNKIISMNTDIADIIEFKRENCISEFENIEMANLWQSITETFEMSIDHFENLKKDN